MALFEAGSEISAETLSEYLPEASATMMPVLSQNRNLPVSTGRGESDHTYEREREMLFSLIFKMRKEIEQLRTDVDQLRDNGVKGIADNPLSTSLVKIHPPIIDAPAEIFDTAEEMPAAAPAVSEKEAIRLSLERNSGRRKAAAQELNISERTLYRKIKEYGLE